MTFEPEVTFLVGPINVEDLARVPGTPWLIGSGMASSGRPAGRLHVIHARDGRWTAHTPDTIPVRHDDDQYGPVGPPPSSNFDAHGVALRPGTDGHHTLYLVNHGGREAIEVFDVDATVEPPTLTWLGAIVQDDGVLGNAVAVLPDNALVATKFLDLGDETATAKISAGEVTGSLKEWQPGMGWSDVAGSECCAPNGVEASADGRWLYMCAWGINKVVRVSRGTDPVLRAEVAVDVMPDNVKWGGDGRLLVAGSVSTPDVVFERTNTEDDCNLALRVVRVHPETLEVEEVVFLAHEVFGTAGTAYDVGTELWIASPRSDRVARFPGRGLGAE
jgi:hypothetical protein